MLLKILSCIPLSIWIKIYKETLIVTNFYIDVRQTVQPRNVITLLLVNFGGLSMDKHSFVPTADSSPSCCKTDYNPMPEEKKSDLSLYESQPIEGTRGCSKLSFEDAVKKKTRRHSFIQLEGDTQIMIEKMIRDQIQMHGKSKGNIKRKMSLDDDQTCICTSDIYTKDAVHWKNREISQLTTKKLDSIQIGKIKKIKILSQQPMTGYNLLRVSVGQKDVKDFAIRTIDMPLWFGSAIWICLVNAGHETNVKRDFEGQMEGQILKKSQFLGNWQRRYVNISKNGLVSSRKRDGGATVKIKQTAEIWTRLETIVFQDVKYVIIKTWHMMFKYEFAIPVGDCVRWAKAFTTLLK